MTDPPPRSMLSAWVKAPEKEDIGPPKVPVDAKNQWRDIFKPRKPPQESGPASVDPVEPQEEPQNGSRQILVPTPKRKRKVNPFNPFNSFVVTLCVPKNMPFPLPRQVEETENTKTTGDTEPRDQQMENSETQVKAEQVEQAAPLDQDLSAKPKKKSLSAFFSKRPTAPIPAPIPRARLQKPQHAPWDVVHLRPPQSWPRRRVDKRRRRTTRLGLDWSQAWSPTGFYAPTALPTPQRRVLPAKQVAAIAQHAQSSQSLQQTEHLAESAGDPSAFDLGRFEGRMWSEKYAPQLPQTTFTPDSAGRVREWLATQATVSRREARRVPKKRRTSLGGFVVDGDDDSDDGGPESTVLVLYGPPGSGKTAAVHAAARSLDTFVFEVSAAVKRTGKELAAMLDGIGRNHAVHRAKSVLILIDDADVVYENEAGAFWPTLAKFVAAARRPVALTCTDASLVNLPSLNTEYLRMQPPNLVVVTDLAWTIALKEGHLLDKQRLANLVVAAKGDVRHVLATLQFWCQWGIGGRPSGSDWVPKCVERTVPSGAQVPTADEPTATEPAELEQLPEQLVDSEVTESDVPESDVPESDVTELDVPTLNEAKEPAPAAPAAATLPLNRVVSDNTWFQLPTERDAEPLDTPSSTTDALSLDHVSLDRLSLDDVLATQSVQYDVVERPDDSVWPHEALPLHAWLEPSTAQVTSYERGLFALFTNHYVLPSTASMRELLLDVGPYARTMAAFDASRRLYMDAALENQSRREVRMTRRIWQATGRDARQHLGLPIEVMQSILRTGFPSLYTTQPEPEQPEPEQSEQGDDEPGSSGEDDQQDDQQGDQQGDDTESDGQQDLTHEESSQMTPANRENTENGEES